MTLYLETQRAWLKHVVLLVGLWSCCCVYGAAEWPELEFREKTLHRSASTWKLDCLVAWSSIPEDGTELSLPVKEDAGRVVLDMVLLDRKQPCVVAGRGKRLYLFRKQDDSWHKIALEEDWQATYNDLGGDEVVLVRGDADSRLSAFYSKGCLLGEDRWGTEVVHAVVQGDDVTKTVILESEEDRLYAFLGAASGESGDVFFTALTLGPDRGRKLIWKQLGKGTERGGAVREKGGIPDIAVGDGDKVICICYEDTELTANFLSECGWDRYLIASRAGEDESIFPVSRVVSGPSGKFHFLTRIGIGSRRDAILHVEGTDREWRIERAGWSDSLLPASVGVGGRRLLTVDAAGDLHATWCMYAGLVHAWRNRTSGLWNQELAIAVGEISGANHLSGPCVQVGPDGLIHVAFLAFRQGGVSVWYAKQMRNLAPTGLPRPVQP